MTKICLITCYSGTIPDYFPLWLKTSRNNSTIDFLFVTDDDTPFDYPDNVKRLIMPFEQVRERIIRLFDFKAELNTPYKLCDYKPAYGEAFAEYIKDYDFWGYCDIDVLWGDMRKFLTEDLLSRYDRILTRGHCSLFRNNPDVNKLYRTLTASGCQCYKDVYLTNENRAYDEWAGHLGWGISEIFRRHGVSQYDEKVYLGPNFLKVRMYFEGEQEKGTEPYIVSCEDGRIFANYVKNGELHKKEYMYFHFQKRVPVIDARIGDNFVFLPPNRVKNLDHEITLSDIKNWQRIKGIYTLPVRFRFQQIRKKLFMRK